jgi:hypothetical protein
MNPRKVAAQFAAYVWCVDGQQRSPKEAAHVARENWRVFLPIAHDGLGELLIRIASLDEEESAHKTSPRRTARSAVNGRKRAPLAAAI